jgi:hypothetical protein
MRGVWERLKRRLHPRVERQRRVPVSERFAHFRAVGAANDAFLDGLSKLRRDAEQRGLPAAPL